MGHRGRAANRAELRAVGACTSGSNLQRITPSADHDLCLGPILPMRADRGEQATPERRSQDQPRGISTTKAGSLIKHQVPVRTFTDWNDAKPGFMEADLVAHCGARAEGRYLYSLVLTDIATGWAECLALLHRSQEAVPAGPRLRATPAALPAAWPGHR
jgi:hypothetical protein